MNEQFTCAFDPRGREEGVFPYRQISGDSGLGTRSASRTCAAHGSFGENGTQIPRILRSVVLAPNMEEIPVCRG